MSCYLCNDEDYTIRKGAVRDAPHLRIRECAGCGLVYLSSKVHIGTGHYEDSGMHGDTVLSMEAWLQEADQDDQRRFDMLKQHLVDRSVLDYGCGAAGFLQKAKALSAKAAGVEPERRVREHWGGSLQLYGSLEEVKDTYDLITAFHVIEHLPDPRTTLKGLSRLLNERGRMVVEVPSSDDALLTLFDCDAFQHFTYWSQHLFLFNEDTLRQLAQQAGLRVSSIKQYQRYPLSNHLYWLSQKAPGGHKQWSFLDNPELSEAYAASLAAVGKCDTLIAYLEK